jgi:hypothetical protein
VPARLTAARLTAAGLTAAGLTAAGLTAAELTAAGLTAVQLRAACLITSGFAIGPVRRQRADWPHRPGWAGWVAHVDIGAMAHCPGRNLGYPARSLPHGSDPQPRELGLLTRRFLLYPE